LVDFFMGLVAGTCGCFRWPRGEEAVAEEGAVVHVNAVGRRRGLGGGLGVGVLEEKEGEEECWERSCVGHRGAPWNHFEDR